MKIKLCDVVHIDYAAINIEGDLTDVSSPDVDIYESSLTVSKPGTGRGSLVSEAYLLRTKSKYEALDWVSSFNIARQFTT